MAIGGNRIIPGNTAQGGGGGAAFPFLVSVQDFYYLFTTVGGADASVPVFPHANTITQTGTLTGGATLTLAELGNITIIQLVVCVYRGTSVGPITLTVDDDAVLIYVSGELTIAEGFTSTSLAFLVDAGSASAGLDYGFTVTVSDGETSIPIQLTLDIIA